MKTKGAKISTRYRNTNFQHSIFASTFFAPSSPRAKIPGRFNRPALEQQLQRELDLARGSEVRIRGFVIAFPIFGSMRMFFSISPAD
jgi:hypothetical protein